MLANHFDINTSLLLALGVLQHITTKHNSFHLKWQAPKKFHGV
ncbi:hypothetical protein OIU77_007446 [Salix suchowensis]|uniref:Uncharacterized protein n=1 Tax=Salix suchowensis TaxID=1278906 RepID=A0ABQ9AIE4_9ROSI|nr:hypothetical protein OIU77_007446 [Salix suchowensis]